MASGLVVVDKPAGCTSHDVVAKLRKIYSLRRVGHAGTLDPDATGVLLVALGPATRLLQYLAGTGKAYRGTVSFGVATDTLDAAGTVLERRAMAVTHDEVRDAAKRFVGDIFQVPPMVSALRVGGRRLHELAREGKEVERQPRPVQINRCDIEAFEPGPFPLATVYVECSTGTYIRTLAADLGATLGGCAHLAALRRTRVGSFTIDEARSIDAIAADPSAAVLAPLVALRDLPRVDIAAETVAAVLHGSVFPPTALGIDPEVSGPWTIVGPDGALLAVYDRFGAAVKPSVVLNAAGA